MILFHNDRGMNSPATINLSLCDVSKNQTGQRCVNVGWMKRASGGGVGAISEASRRFAKELETDGELREVVARIKGRLKICRM